MLPLRGGVGERILGNSGNSVWFLHSLGRFPGKSPVHHLFQSYDVTLLSRATREPCWSVVLRVSTYFFYRGLHEIICTFGRRGSLIFWESPGHQTRGFYCPRCVPVSRLHSCAFYTQISRSRIRIILCDGEGSVMGARSAARTWWVFVVALYTVLVARKRS